RERRRRSFRRRSMHGVAAGWPDKLSALAALTKLGVHFELAVERNFWRGVGLLPGDAPIFQLIKRDDLARYRTAHERTGREDLKVAVQIAQSCFFAAGAFKTVHSCSPF